MIDINKKIQIKISLKKNQININM